ncbi:MAG: thiamine pyrophosphate-binding protein [Burkholderiaceae bacterium]|nr:MAG: thiamine pyrophosphate-binding protein [Burkholderiaceae bacterium]
MQPAVLQGVAPVLNFDAADLIVSYLESIGVEYVFGIPGGAIEPLYNALARSQRNGGLHPVVARHETGAAFMADGYARETGRIGVCIATSGPGSTNLITGVSCAYDNHIPMLLITGQPALPSFGKHALQESTCTGVNILSMFQHCTCYNTLVSHAEQLEYKLVNAFMRAHQAQRPAHLSIPIDVLRSPLKQSAPAYDLRSRLQKTSFFDEHTVHQLADEIRHAHKMVFVIGGGCAEAIAPIMELIHRTHGLFITTPDGKGLINPAHPAYRGVFGFAGHQTAIDLLLGKPDLILAFGAAMGEFNSGAWNTMLLNERLVHIDSLEDHLLRTPMAKLHVQGCLQTVCRHLLDELQKESAPAGVSPVAHLAVLPSADKASVSDATPIKPQRLMRELSRRCPPTTRILADAGNSMSWAVHHLQLCDRRVTLRKQDGITAIYRERRYSDVGWLRVVTNFAPMGWAIGAAIGVARGTPDCPVVCITGDGAWLMSGQEITTAVQEQLTVIFISLNDSAYGMVKHGQRLTGGEPIAFELPPVDFGMMAQSMGVPSHVIHSPADLDALDFDVIFQRRGPTLLDVRIDPEEVPPMGQRVKTLTGQQP